MRRPLVTSLAPFAAIVLLSMGHVACSGDSSGDGAATSAEALVEVDGDDDGSTIDPEADAELGPDPEPMAADDEIDRAAERADDVQDVEAARELDLEVDAPLVAAAAAAPRCHKRIHVTFAVYTYLTPSIAGNGCWIPERTVQDTSFRDCHSDGSIKNGRGDKWFYDDTNPRNDLGRERAALGHCAAGTKRGYEYMAFRDGRWRLVTERHTSAYFAELYTDDAHIDNLYYTPGVYRGNGTLRRHRRVAPMLNFAPFPDTYSQHQIAREVLKVCKTVRNHGFLGLYEWHYPLPHDSPRVATLVRALNACTRKR